MTGSRAAISTAIGTPPYFVESNSGMPSTNGVRRVPLNGGVPADFFFDLFSGFGLATNVSGDVLREIGSRCPNLLFGVGSDLTYSPETPGISSRTLHGF